MKIDKCRCGKQPELIETFVQDAQASIPALQVECSCGIQTRKFGVWDGPEFKEKLIKTWNGELIDKKDYPKSIYPQYIGNRMPEAFGDLIEDYYIQLNEYCLVLIKEVFKDKLNLSSESSISDSEILAKLKNEGYVFLCGFPAAKGFYYKNKNDPSIPEEGVFMGML